VNTIVEILLSRNVTAWNTCGTNFLAITTLNLMLSFRSIDKNGLV
jgi:hypothetical protein